MKESKFYSLEDISKHDNEDDCWVTIEDSVYDITKFIPDHITDEIIG